METKLKLGMDMCYFTNIHRGGKDEVAYNLLRGFEQIGVGSQVVCFCFPELKKHLKQICPSADICVLPNFFKKHGCHRLCEYLAKIKGINLLLFTNKPSPQKKFMMKTVEIPHDIQVFENDKMFGIHYTKEEYEILTQRISSDFKYRDYIIAISNFDKNEMLKFLPDAADKVKVIYDPIRFDNVPECVANSENYITVINIQWIHKNAITVIKAFKLIHDKTQLKLILVGKFPDNIDELKKYVKDNNLEDSVIFTGFVDDDELQKIISETRIYINASYFEGFGMTAIEMMGRKIPTIVAQSTSMPEVTLGLCRYYSPIDDSDALARTILEELEHPITDGELKKISNTVRDRYNLQRISREYWEFFNKCLQAKDLK